MGILLDGTGEQDITNCNYVSLSSLNASANSTGANSGTSLSEASKSRVSPYRSPKESETCAL
jgi:hypothetical protein